LAGDSSGANLALGVNYLAILFKTRKPDGILLAYPALNLDLDRFHYFIRIY
jgi:hormone-sensitive lipase